MSEQALIRDRLSAVQAQIASACARSGRTPDEVTLVAVSKTHPVEAVIAALAGGARHFGENRLEEASAKIQAVQTAHATGGPIPTWPIPTWHMVGHVQSRKAADAVATFDVIHSLDTVKLAERYARAGTEQGHAPQVLVEVNVSGEASKEGFDCSTWEHAAEVRAAIWGTFRQLTAFSGLNVAGLMTMAPIVAEVEQTRPVFRSLRLLHAALSAEFPSIGPTLSMGMTDDFPVAIEEGATIVRIGRAIFGERKYGSA